MKKHALAASLCTLVALVAGCGGGDGVVTPRTTDAADDPTTTAEALDDPTTTAEADDSPTTSEVSDETTPATAATADAGELPDFLMDFDRVCTTQVGFSGATTYEETPGLHPMVLFEEWREDGDYLQSVAAFPAGWTVTEDDNFDDNAELVAAQIVACADRVQETPNGTSCDFDSDDGSILTLELVDAVYDVSAYEATTGEELGVVSISAATTECPYFVSVQAGDTQYINRPTEDDYTVALRPFVER